MFENFLCYIKAVALKQFYGKILKILIRKIKID